MRGKIDERELIDYTCMLMQMTSRKENPMNAAPPHCCAASARWHALLIWLRPFRLSRDQRLFFLISSLVQWLGISLSGFDVH